MALSITAVQSGERDVQITLSNGVTIQYAYSNQAPEKDFDAHHLGLHADQMYDRLPSTVNVDVMSDGNVSIYGTINYSDQANVQWYDVPDVQQNSREEIARLKEELERSENLRKAAYADNEALAKERDAFARTITSFLDLSREATETHNHTL